MFAKLDALHLTRTGQLFFAVAVIGIGVEHFVFNDFMMGRAPAWPENLPGKLGWAYLTGLFFILTGLAIIGKKRARQAAILAGILIFLWAFLRNIPVIASSTFLSGDWTRAGKALTFFGGSLAVATTFPKIGKNSKNFVGKIANSDKKFITIGRICLGIFLIMTGIQHFLFTEFVASLIPAWFPGNAVFWTYFAGIALIAGGVGLFITKSAWIAALLSGLMVFSWFWIVHLPRTFFSVSDGIAIFEALMVSGIAFVIAENLRKRLP